MKNLSIRTKILSGVVLVNLIGMLVVMIYLHQSYSGNLDLAAQESVTLNVAVFNELQNVGADEIGDPTTAKGAQSFADLMKNITTHEYGILIDKATLDQEEYAKAREEANLPNNWDERENYVLMGTTDAALAETMQMKATPDSIPEIGKVVGVENGACSRTCHGAVQGSGDFWKVRWSKDSTSRAHTVFPIERDGKLVGVVYSIEDVSRSADAARKSVLSTMAVIVSGLIIATFVIAVLLNGLVFGRLDRMIKSMEDISIRVAGGDFGAHFTPDGTSDEIGKFEAFFSRFMDLMSGTLRSLVK